MKEQSANLREAESSRLTQPAWVYRIVSGVNSYFFTSYDKPIVIADGPPELMDDPQTFLAVPIEHQPPKESADVSSEPTVISVAANDTLLRKYFVTAPTEQIECNIWRINSASLPGPISYADLFMDYKGVCQSVSFAGYQIEASFTTPVQQEDRVIPNYIYQKTCNHVLGDRFCGVNHENFKLVTTAQAVSRANKTVTISDASLNVDSPSRSISITAETFQGGKLIDPTGQRIGIVACEVLADGKRRLWLSYWPGTIQVGSSITLYLGCLKIVRVCADTFDNKENFGGIPYIPATNPALNSIVT